ncbi:MAG: hypothetical protein J1F35_05365 [Erysipelotrichales bacterium]|nr:hypothetical protein [Erysipelotrichales bacterium]
MNKCCFQNLAMVVSDVCNMNCAHCLHGKKERRKMSDEVIEATLEQTLALGTLSICGGELTLALDRLESIIDYLIEHHIYLTHLTATINGTIYSEEMIRLFEEINNYIGAESVRAFFSISIDKYHIDEMKRLNIIDEFGENIQKYKESKYFYDFRTIDKKLLCEGNAQYLDNNLTIPLIPIKHYITYVNSNLKFDKEHGRCEIGPLVTINQAGVITECDASTIHQRTVYNYGNVLNGSIEKQLLENNAIVLPPKRYLRACNKEVKRWNNYNG